MNVLFIIIIVLLICVFSNLRSQFYSHVFVQNKIIIYIIKGTQVNKTILQYLFTLIVLLLYNHISMVEYET